MSRATKRRPVEVIEKPEGWQRERFVALSSKERRRTGNSHRREPLRGKQRCCHTEFLTNRAGKVLKDPDTGFLAYVACKRIARFELRIDRGFAVEIRRACERHVESVKEKATS